MDTIKNILDYIGFQGPIITTIITSISLLDKPYYLYAFIAGTILNNSLNELLKNIIKQPRPQHPKHYIDDILIKGAHVYGMPSGHAQISAFAITYLYLTHLQSKLQLNNTTIWVLISIFIFGLTIIQRWSFRRHTLEQLAIGTIVGTSFAYLLYWIVKNYLE